MVLANWAKLPRTLFAKAWVTTGHVSKEKMMEVANIDEAEWEACNIQGDGSGLITHLGPLASDEPSIEELIQNGAMKRKRVLWTISRSSSEEPSAVLPGSLVWPVERRLSSFLFAQASAESDSLKTWTTIVISRRAGKEVSTDLLRKRTKVNADGTRAFMADVPNRTLKDCFIITEWVHHLLPPDVEWKLLSTVYLQYCIHCPGLNFGPAVRVCYHNLDLDISFHFTGDPSTSPVNW